MAQPSRYARNRWPRPSVPRCPGRDSNPHDPRGSEGFKFPSAPLHGADRFVPWAAVGLMTTSGISWTASHTRRLHGAVRVSCALRQSSGYWESPGSIARPADWWRARSPVHHNYKGPVTSRTCPHTTFSVCSVWGLMHSSWAGCTAQPYDSSALSHVHSLDRSRKPITQCRRS